MGLWRLVLLMFLNSFYFVLPIKKKRVDERRGVRHLRAYTPNA